MLHLADMDLLGFQNLSQRILESCFLRVVHNSLIQRVVQNSLIPPPLTITPQIYNLHTTIPITDYIE
jgi:hypothetical protein